MQFLTLSFFKKLVDNTEVFRTQNPATQAVSQPNANHHRTKLQNRFPLGLKAKK